VAAIKPMEKIEERRMQIIMIFEIDSEQLYFLLANKRIRRATHYDIQAAVNRGNIIYRDTRNFNLYVE
jgi:hypothetical protein